MRPTLGWEVQLIEDADFKEFLAKEYARLVAAVALVASSRPAAEDAVQEALVRAWERTRKGEQIDSLNAWVATVALNISRSGLRRKMAERRARYRLDSAPAIERSHDDAVDVERAVALLPRRQREVVVLRYLLDLNTTETASTLRISEGTVKSELSRARAALALRLQLDHMEVSNDAGP
ncbi:MAG: sigma-70 family RNA polymerase sigma factor [Actinomycetota bacterium]